MRTALVRPTDPATAQAAADQARRSTAQDRVLALLHEHGPMTHDQIIAAHQRRVLTERWPRSSSSRLRTATHELVDAGLVEAVTSEAGRSALGHPAAYWRALTVQGA